MTFAHGKMRLIEVTLDSNAPAVVDNLTLDELRLPDSLRVVAVVRNEQPLVPSGTMHFLEQDHVVLMARTDATAGLHLRLHRLAPQRFFERSHLA